MAYETKNNSGILFRNEKKAEGSNQPDYNGNCMVNGKMMDMSAWLKTGKTGKKFMSFQFKEPWVKGEQKPASAPAGKFADMDDDIPF